MTKKEQLRKKIIEANPDILDKKKGCIVFDRIKGEMTILESYSIPNETNVYYYCYRIGKNEDLTFERSPNNFWEIIGRKITLEDVMITTDKQDTDIRVDNSGLIVNLHTEKGEFWELGKDLDSQPQKTIDYLWDLICKNNE